MTDAFRCFPFQKCIELGWDIVPCAPGERAVRLVQHCDVAGRVWHKREALDRVVRETEAGLSDELHELLHV